MGDVLEFECVVNTSGIIPVDVKVLVLPDEVPEKTPGGLIRPQETQHREQMAQTKATLVAVGEGAFRDWYEVENWERCDTREPRPGNRVIIDRYAGVRCEGADGQNYQLINDKDILAILSEEQDK